MSHSVLPSSFEEKGELMGEKKADEKDCPTNLEPTG
jgi:hypothetical protein